MTKPMRSRTAPPRPAGAGSSASTILIGANEDHRRLLRGLLLMSHRPIALEAPSLGAIPDPSPDAPPRILVFVAPSDGEPWSEELRGALRTRPELNALVLLPLDAPGTRASAARAGARAVLGRPFTSRDFTDALDRMVGSPPVEPTSRRPAASRKARRR
ncbi:MAG: hypothetical protein WBG19_08505 [Thermoplasmata archaeon]